MCSRFLGYTNYGKWINSRVCYRIFPIFFKEKQNLKKGARGRLVQEIPLFDKDVVGGGGNVSLQTCERSQVNFLHLMGWLEWC